MAESAKVIVRVTDNSMTVAPGGPTYLGAVITAPKGSTTSCTFVNSLESLVENFGAVTADHPGMLAAAKYLEKGNRLYLVRVVGSDASAAKCDFNNSESSKIGEIHAKNPGTYGNSLSVVVSESGTKLAIKDGEDTVEEFTISMNPASENYVELIKSKYVNIIDSSLGSSASAKVKDGTIRLSGGSDGVVNASDYVGRVSPGKKTGSKLFEDTSIEVNVLATFGYTDKTFIQALGVVADKRNDCVVIVDCPPGKTYQEAITWANESPAITGTKLAVYWDWQYYTVNGKRVLCPSTGYVAANIAESDNNYGLHYPVAGPKRGIINSEGMAQSPDVTERDLLVDGGINPIAYMGTQGIVIMGNVTRHSLNSDLKSLHIVRELTKIVNQVKSYTEGLYFELHKESTWNQWTDSVSSFLEGEKSVSAVQWYSVAMNRTTMTDDDIANKICKGKVAVQFYQDAEIFDVEFVVESSGSQLS